MMYNRVGNVNLHFKQIEVCQLSPKKFLIFVLSKYFKSIKPLN